jgi:hypothetical protein
MGKTRSDPPQPYLGVRDSGEQAVRSSEFIRTYLVRSGFDVDGYEFGLVFTLQSGTKQTFIYLIAAAGKLFSAITGLGFHPDTISLHYIPACRCCQTLLGGISIWPIRQLRDRIHRQLRARVELDVDLHSAFDNIKNPSDQGAQINA